MKESSQAWLIRVIGKSKYMILLLALIQMVIGAGSVFFALAMKTAIDAAVAGSMDAFWQGLTFMILIVLIQLAARAALRYWNERTSAEIENRLKSRLFHQLLLKEYRQVAALHSGEWMNRLVSDTSFVASHVVTIIPDALGMLVKLVGAVAMIILLQPGLAAILLGCGIIALAVTFLLRKRLKLLHKKIRESDGRVRIFLQERLESMTMLRAFSAEKRTSRDAESLMEEHLSARMQRNRFSNFANTSLGILMYGFYLLGFALCCIGIVHGTVSYGTLTAVLQLIGQIQSPLVNLSAVVPNYYSMLASAERLQEVEQFSDSHQNTAPEPELTDFWKQEFAAIKIRGLRFVYSEAENRGVRVSEELVICRGDLAALTGYSGAGKTTLFKLLLSFYEPDEGTISLSLQSGDEMPVSVKMRSLFAYVPQENQLMSGTIREIVAFAAPEYSSDEERIRSALRAACAEEFVDALPQGLDSILGERGMGLSEGQMQRLSIARAIFSDAPILLLDECTSALDAETERRLLENLKLMQDKTVLMIAHRPAALEICNKVYELQE